MAEPMHLHAPHGVVALAGDWHGSASQARPRIMSLGDRGVEHCFSLGDFGLWPGPSGKTFLGEVEKVCSKFGVRLWVTLGNHEDWGRLTTLWSNPKRQDAGGSPLPIALTDHVTVLPRGWRWTVSGRTTTRTFVSLGGAPSVDFETRTPGVDWWPEEMIEPADVERTVAGGHADVFLAHDAPGPPWATRQVAETLRTNPLGWSPLALSYAAVGRARITEAFLGVRPRLFAHGHHHVGGETTVRLPGCDYDTTIWSLGHEALASNLRLLDLDTLGDVRR